MSVGRSRSTVSNLLRLLNVANQVVAKRMSVRDTEKLVVRTTTDAETTGRSTKSKEKSRDIVQLEKELSDLLMTQVTIKMAATNRGQLIIDFPIWMRWMV